MKFFEFGKENTESILLLHPSVVRWDYFGNVIPLLEKEYHLIIPALPGYDLEEERDFTSVEQIAARDFAMVMFGKWGGVKLLEKVFSTDDYSKEDIQYVADILKQSSKRTLWRTFDSCNNYKVPNPVPMVQAKIHYWYADGEEKERAWDIKYMREKFPDTEFKVLPKLGHAGLVLLKPELFADMIRGLG